MHQITDPTATPGPDTGRRRPAAASPARADAAATAAVEPGAETPAADRDDEDPYRYGWRFRPAADGSGETEMAPLTYADLLDPQEGDVVAEDTIHRCLTEDLGSMLQRRWAGDETVAVWSNLKVNFRIPGLTTGPGPDLVVVRGVRDRDRRRTSFHLGREPGEILLVIELVSKSSRKKDFEDLVDIYGRMGVEEYLAIEARGFYIDGPYELRAWKRDPAAGMLRSLAPVAPGRLLLPAAGLLFVTGGDGWGLGVWDAATGERLLTSEQAAQGLAEQAERAEERAARAEERAELAEERAARAEEEKRQLQAEIERLRSRSSRPTS
jgi:hypothetical protein